MTMCPACGGDDTKVLDTRIDHRGWRMRRRACKDCGHRYWTSEIPTDQLTIEDPDPEPPEEAQTEDEE